MIGLAFEIELVLMMEAVVVVLGLVALDTLVEALDESVGTAVDVFSGVAGEVPRATVVLEGCNVLRVAGA